MPPARMLVRSRLSRTATSRHLEAPNSMTPRTRWSRAFGLADDACQSQQVAAEGYAYELCRLEIDDDLGLAVFLPHAQGQVLLHVGSAPRRPPPRLRGPGDRLDPARGSV